jgi:carbon-monoxide dehydrogenase large subunit
VGTPSLGRSWAEVAAASTEPLAAETRFSSVPTFPFGTHVAVVEVDPDTGRVSIVRFVAVDDAGTIVNPLIVEGQIHGGVAAGIGQALSEEMVFDAEGNPLTTTFAEYGILSAAEVPNIEVVTMETPTPHNPIGAKGIGESGTVGATPAVQNAVVDALSHLGVRHVDMPLGPQRVWEAIQAATTGATGIG